MKELIIDLRAMINPERLSLNCKWRSLEVGAILAAASEANRGDMMEFLSGVAMSKMLKASTISLIPASALECTPHGKSGSEERMAR